MCTIKCYEYKDTKSNVMEKTGSTSRTTMILNHKLSPDGLCISYIQNGLVKQLSASIDGTIFLLRNSGFIKRSWYKKDQLYIKVDVIELMLDENGIATMHHVGDQNITWEYFVCNYDLDDDWCLEIIKLQKCYDLIYN